MADREQPYDPYIPSGQSGGSSAGRDGNQRTAALQARAFRAWALLLVLQRRSALSKTWTLRLLESASYSGKPAGIAPRLFVTLDPDHVPDHSRDNSLFDILLTVLNQEIDSTVNVMRNNINKVSERGERLDSLQDKTDNLAVSAQGFRRGANRVRKQMWWKDMKMRMCLIVGIIILLIVIIVPSVIATKH
ncbi:hypothetical protein MBLNU459_g1773t2 [Dothideomycetes sp. NU459]